VSHRGVQVIQNLDGAPSEASRILVDENLGSLAPFAAEVGDGIFFRDPVDASPVPGRTLLWATRNRLRASNGAGAAASAISADGAAHLKLLGNRLSGEAGVGLHVDTTRGCLVSGNSVGALETGAGPDLRLGPGTRACLAVVGRDDVVQDDGSGNRVLRR
jgi:hypothetical protein